MVKIIFSDHVLIEIGRRRLDREEVEHVIQSPGQEIPSKKGRVVIQGKYYDKTENKTMLMRVIGEKLEDSFYVITAYKTSKMEKYWKGEL